MISKRRLPVRYLPAGKRRKYYVPDFVRGVVRNARGSPSGGFRQFLRFHGLQDQEAVEGFHKLHRRFAGLLNKYGILYEDRVYKTYLHCMKKAYRSPIGWSEAAYRNVLQPLDIPVWENGPWFRLIVLLRGSYLDVLRRIRESKTSAESREAATSGMTSTRTQLGLELKDTTLPTGEIVVHHRGVNVVRLDTGYYVHRGVVYNKRPKPRGFFRMFALSEDVKDYQLEHRVDQSGFQLGFFELLTAMARARELKETHPEFDNQWCFAPWVERISDRPPVFIRDPKGRDQFFEPIEPKVTNGQNGQVILVCDEIRPVSPFRNLYTLRVKEGFKTIEVVSNSLGRSVPKPRAP